ncbi:hypothetical protein [Herbidospora daliensis]|uniref:hypothetical protein n=1 Tax=Herbidospora daliensis TaxID=295585 RepID=UPI0007C7EBC7|nr:hypothetical protein [Herbidospora daliensis]
MLFPALPGRTDDGSEPFHRCVAEVVALLGIEVEPSDAFPWLSQARRAIRLHFATRPDLPPEAFDALMKAAVHDPDPSFNRGFVEPALNAFGRRRVRTALLAYLMTGADQEKAGAASAWYWSGLRLRSGGSAEDTADLVAMWHEAALREFVGNEHLDVRRNLVSGLPLNPEAAPPELRPLVEEVVRIARAHPDEYIRHRVEIQVRV